MMKTTSFRWRQFFTILTLSLVLLIFTLGVALPTTRNFVVNHTIDQLSVVAGLKINQVEHWLEDGLQAAQLMTLNPGLLEKIQALHSPLNQTHTKTIQSQILLILNKYLETYPEIQSVSFLDPISGKVMVSTNSNEAGRSHLNDAYFSPGHNELFISPLEYSLDQQAPILTISSPVKNPYGKLISVITVEMRFEYLEFIFSTYSGMHKPTVIYLADQNGYYVSYPDGFTHLSSTLGESYPISQPSQGINGYGFYKNPFGMEVLGVYRWLPQLNLALLVEMEESNLITEYRATWLAILVGDLALIGITIISSNSLTNRLVTPLKKISSAAQALQSGDFTHRAEITGPDETRHLAVIFNQMANALQQSHQSQEEIITQRTLALQQTEAQLESIIQTAPDAVISLDENMNIIIFNNAAEIMFACRAKEAIHDNIIRFIPEFHKIAASHTINGSSTSGIYSQPMTSVFESQALTWSGEAFPIEASFSKVKVEGKYILSIILRNITERKSIQDRIETSLHDKEILLKEIHHRVKNNLQIISSLLYLQSKKIKDQNVIQLFEDGRSRIQSMALIHEKLYQNPSLSCIDFGEYIESLIVDLQRSFGTVPKKADIVTRINNISLDIDTAIPCGLITNELVSNALKYAFPGQKPGTITISLEEISSNKFQFIIQDDGIGIPNDFDLSESPSLGLELVTNLVNRIDGKLTIDTQSGTSFKIIFPKKK